MDLFLNEKLGEITLEIDESKNPIATIILAHGAGAGMHHPSMIEISKKLIAYDFNVVRFNFPYMEQGRKSPGSPKSNIETWEIVIDHISNQYKNLPLYMAGKSYGGRMGSHFLSENHDTKVKGVIYFGFPLHAPGRDSKDRANHLDKVRVPQFFLQGAKDKLANIEMMKEVVSDLDNAELLKIEFADHSFNAPKSSGKTKDDIVAEMAKRVANWIG